MRVFVRVPDVLKLFPWRRKSWAYDLLRRARGPGRAGGAVVRDVAVLLGFDEPELRKYLGGGFDEAPAQK